MSPRTFYAHSLEGAPESEWQTLPEHLEGVAALAERFAAAFGAADWGRLAGLWHDLGKYRLAFQAYIRGEGPGAEHAVVGALLAQRQGTPAQRLALAFVVAGHHGGLTNLEKGDGGAKPLMPRLKDSAPLLAEALPHVPGELAGLTLPALPARLMPRGKLSRAGKEQLRRSTELWIRFLFSALIDADRLDTERFYHGGRRQRLTAGFEGIPALRDRLDRHVDKLAARAARTEVNALRSEVLTACRAEAELPLGLFSLSVPTGGGKTLAAMAFALRHAVSHGLRRVIVAIPFTSIIEQNAKVYREALGAGNVIEHHSSLDPEKESQRNKLASENWDAPVVVTTTVQLFESLFARRASRCRKLHNVARSVILLDEVQTLPPSFLEAILEGLRELADNYGCTVLLSTATQPALARRPGLRRGLENVREIVIDPEALARRLSRFDVEWPDLAAEPIEWDELAAELRELPRVLTIVHRRQDARDLAQRLPEEGLFHLSALMCAAHRSAVLEGARARLETGGDCRLVSTQLIEAGVDIDFPLVYRAFAGIDSLVQAGGRCNREGDPKRGRLVVFRAPTEPPPGTPQRGVETMQALLELHDGSVDIEDPALVTAYFEMLYGKKNLDEKAVQTERQQLNFATVDRLFQLIEDGYSRPVVVPYGDAAERLERFRADPGRGTLRALQPYTVNVPVWQLERMRGALEDIHETVFALTAGYERLYDDRYGLVIEDEPVADPAAYTV